MEPLKGYEIAVAKRDDAEEVLSLLKDVAHWLEKKGSKQWEDLISGEGHPEIIEALEQKLTFIVRENARIVATFTVYPRANSWDEWLWEPVLENESTENHHPAAYLHKLAITPDEAGKGLGREIMIWLENDLREKGIQRLRLDCIADNEKLNTFYTELAYRKVCNRYGFSLYEKAL